MEVPALTFRLASVEEAEALHQLEAESFPPDEAASLEKILFRLQNAGDYFMGAYGSNGELLGMVNATLTAHDCLTHESMSTHDPSGSLLCIHTVIIRKPLRRHGLATHMLVQYVDMMRAMKNVREIQLISKEYLIPFYQRCGFELLKPSDVEHGKEKWFDFRLILRP